MKTPESGVFQEPLKVAQGPFGAKHTLAGAVAPECQNVAEHGNVFEAVSYTHLDVYKRQPYRHLELCGIALIILYQALMHRNS